MNETVYLFALSVPDILEQMLADQSRRHADAVPPQPEKRS